MFQFEGGLYATALVLDAAYKLADTAKKAPTIAEVGSYMLHFVQSEATRKPHWLYNCWVFVSSAAIFGSNLGWVKPKTINKKLLLLC